MAHIILTGATGTAGAAVLNYALGSPSISKISILSRRPVALASASPKANVIIHKDFEQYPPEVLEQLKGATGCVWAQGISSRGMTEEEYTKITVDYPVAAAKAFSTLGDKMKFVYVSGEGAVMPPEKAGMMFGRVKGQVERDLLDLQKETGSLRVFNVRPAAINPQGNYLAERKPSLMQDRLATGLGGILERVWPSMATPTVKLAQVLVDLAIGDGEPVPAGKGVEAEGRVLRNVAVRRLAGI